jgi:hypothetical protein
MSSGLRSKTLILLWVLSCRFSLAVEVPVGHWASMLGAMDRPVSVSVFPVVAVSSLPKTEGNLRIDLAQGAYLSALTAGMGQASFHFGVEVQKILWESSGWSSSLGLALGRVQEGDSAFATAKGFAHLVRTIRTSGWEWVPSLNVGWGPRIALGARQDRWGWSAMAGSSFGKRGRDSVRFWAFGIVSESERVPRIAMGCSFPFSEPLGQ